jgi:hypothetical protein
LQPETQQRNNATENASPYRAGIDKMGTSRTSAPERATRRPVFLESSERRGDGKVMAEQELLSRPRSLSPGGGLV